MQGQQYYSDLASFINHRILKRDTNEAGVVVTDVYGTVVNTHCKVLYPHGNDPVKEAEFTLQCAFSSNRCKKA
jgi:hypothetical protein